MAGAALGRGLAQIRGIPFISDVPPVLLSMSIATGVYMGAGLQRAGSWSLLMPRVRAGCRAASSGACT